MTGPLTDAPVVAPPQPPAAPAPAERDEFEISRLTRGRMRPHGSRREVAVWYLIRITGLGLFVLALAHFSILHFIYDPADQTAEFIAGQRWNQILWRVLDWSLLMLVLFHAFLGMRTVLQDYFHGPRSRRIVLGGLYLIGALLFVLGTVVVLTLPSPTGAPA
jgi:succinate dehydrogenase / fumarate reductase membrane anchor subunit